LVLACVAGVNAFLPAAAPRMSVQRPMTMLQKPASLQVAKSSTMALKQSESATIVAAEAKTSLLDKVWNKNTKLTIYLSIWYLGNIYYNIWNKKACNALGKNALGASNAHWALSAAQLAFGIIFVVPMWAAGLRKKPEMSTDNWKEMVPAGFFSSLAHAFSVMALGAGAVSFGQIVKAGEPVFAAATNAVLLKEVDHPLVYAALLPIIAGVGLASLKELSFTWTALIAASLANQAAALKNVVSKSTSNKPWAKAMGAANQYAVLNIIAFLCTLPLVLAFDVKDFAAVSAQIAKMGTGADAVKYAALSGLAFYVYNEASFSVLALMDPVSHSVANTLKRVVIIVASCIVFKTPMSTIGAIGSAIAVGGTLLYSMAKKKFHKK